jgi:hypothetical protein
MAMKKKVILLALSGMMMLMGGLPASAQTAYNFKMSASFYAGNAKLPAGTYTLRQNGDDANMFSLQNSSGSHSVILETRQSSKASKGKPEIVFNRYAGTDYLEAVETNDGNSIDIMPGAAEKLAAKKGAPEPHRVPTA